jgi:hypothetical protein
VNFVDDTLFICNSKEAADEIGDVFRGACGECGVPISEDKTIMGTIAPFLGFMIDTIAWQFYLSEENRIKYLNMFREWDGKTQASMKQIQSLHGVVTHLPPAYPGGRSFTRRIAELLGATRKQKAVNVTNGLKADLKFWIVALSRHRGMSITPRTFGGEVPEFYSDATPFGGGAIYGCAWWALEWNDLEVSGHNLDDMPETLQITFFEMLAVIMSCANWAQQWRGKKVLCHCDNKGVVSLAVTRYSRHPPTMALLRRLFYLELEHDFVLTAVHIAGVDNKVADAISRKEWSKFRELAPHAKAQADVCKWDSIKRFGSFDLKKADKEFTDSQWNPTTVS